MNEQEVREAIKEWESLSANQENKVLYEARLKYLRDQLSNILGERRAGREEGREEGIKKGINKGIKEGIQKEREAVIRKMLSKGTAPDSIADMLDYPLEEIKKIEWKIESSN